MNKLSFTHKKIVSISVLLLLIAVFFWSGSRYPQLNEKALMGGDTSTMGISFDVIRDIQKGDGLVAQILTNTLNWVETNKKGMLFGILFGSALMVLFSLLKNIQSRNRWLNTFLGTIIGAPLGVCVNCAAPIAKGMRDAGARSETALATMFSSPTLNVIVLSMLFAMLPPYMVWLKIGCTLFFLLLMVPILAKTFPSKDVSTIPEQKTKLPLFIQEEETEVRVLASNSWITAIKWSLIHFLKSLWFLIKTTVPLMLLAGLLGNLLITFLPLEGLIRYVPLSSTFNVILYMVGIALVGVFLPVPIAFDVIIVAILWSAGLPARYAVILLVTLGTYSIYSAFIVSKAFSLKLSIVLFFIVGGLGVLSGFLGHRLEQKLNHEYRAENYDSLKENNSAPSYYEVLAANNEPIDNDEVRKLLVDTLISKVVYEDEALKLNQTLFNSKDRSNNDWFTEVEGQSMGLDIPYVFSVWEFVEPLANQRSIATGDVHHDGYPDVLIASAGQLFLHANQKGRAFKRQVLKITQSGKIVNAALVDLDNDGWLDIFWSTYRNGNYILYNEEGRFDQSQAIRLPQLEQMIISQSVAFADLDGDTLLDMVLGNWSMGSLGARFYSLPESQNFCLMNKGKGQFELLKLKENNGETLTSLLTDFTGDGKIDLWVGNDFEIDDNFYQNKGDGKLEQIENPEKMIEKITQTTMSITSADINNDLSPEIYLAQIDRGNQNDKTLDLDIICSSIKDEEQRKHCIEVFRRQKWLSNTIISKNYESCPDEYRSDCIAMEMIQNRDRISFLEKPVCEYLPNSWSAFEWICNYKFDETRRHDQIFQSGVDVQQFGGVVLEKNQDGFYQDRTENYNLETTGWAWNSKFADVDNDGFQDLFVANGYLIKPLQESNILYLNKGGEAFSDMTQKSGLENYLPTSSYSYVDYDLDGDLDIIAATAVGPVFVYENKNHQNHSISFELKDYKGNNYGVGSRIYIYYGRGSNQIREVLASGGYKSFDAPVSYFGLGRNENIDKLRIVWPDGEESIVKRRLEANANYTIVRK